MLCIILNIENPKIYRLNIRMDERVWQGYQIKTTIEKLTRFLNISNK